MTLPRRRWSFSLRTLFVLVTLSLPAGAAENQDDSETHIKALIEQLVTSDEVVGPFDPKPEIKEGAHARAMRAYKELIAIGPKAFPYLLEKRDDNRHFTRADGGSIYSNWTVGKACGDIVIYQIQPNRTRVRPGPGQDPHKVILRPFYPDAWFDDQESTKKWWAAHKTRTLADLQVEVLEWIIAEEAKTPEVYPDEERAFLQERLMTIRSTAKPLKFGSPWSK